ncbi:MAG: DNA gyrase subunit A [Arenimonas sp.]|nr:DNA gyrase subunit A [Arenimonas sp.]
MSDLAKEVIPVNLEDEMRRSYLDYAMSVIVGRALPDVRDGLKPVHRRVLFAMHELGAHSNKPYYKSARIVGDVIGKYHPHGDQSVYDTLVRMAQPFSLRYLLVDGQGNFGSVDGDSAAAMRYTEARMAKITHELLADLDKDTVDFQPNYDEKEHEPTVMPTKVPNLLINGSEGIAVGMATKIPPHNLSEIINGTIALIDDPEISIAELITHIPGPDFPTAAIINGSAGIHAAYHTGRGRVVMRAKAEIEIQDNGREAIIILELPFQVNKARLIEKIADLVKEKKLEGISELRDESDKDGMRVYIEIKRDHSAEIVLNHLYSETPLQQSFGINMVAIVDRRPQLLNLKQILEAFVRHRREVVTRRTLFELRKARARAHILEGLTVALANIDEMIALIKTSQNPQTAKERMMEKRWEPGLVRALLGAAGAHASRPEELSDEFGLHENGYQLSEVQAKEILEMRLNRLTGLEQEKLTDEYRELLLEIQDLIEILEVPERLLTVIRDELLLIKENYGDDRRTEIRASEEDLEDLDLIASEDVVVTLSHAGYAKRQMPSTYRAQKRGGKGRSAASVKEEDFIERLWVVNTHDTLLTFTSEGRVFWLKVYRLPDSGPNSRGRPIVNWIPLQPGEKVQAVLPVREFTDNKFAFFATKNGTVKKTPLSEFSRPRANGIWAISLDEGDALVDVQMTDGTKDIMLFGSHGKAVRFDESEVRSMGRTATGVRGMRINDKDTVVVSMVVVEGDGDILTASENGFGKRTEISAYPKKGRGTQGVIAIQRSERNGSLVGAIQLSEQHEILLISDQGTMVRTRASEVSQVGRNAQGVTLMRVANDEKLMAIECLDVIEDVEIEIDVDHVIDDVPSSTDDN